MNSITKIVLTDGELSINLNTETSQYTATSSGCSLQSTLYSLDKSSARQNIFKLALLEMWLNSFTLSFMAYDNEMEIVHIDNVMIACMEQTGSSKIFDLIDDQIPTEVCLTLTLHEAELEDKK